MTRGPQIFQTYRSHFTILRARKVTRWNFIPISIKLCMVQCNMVPWVYTHLIMAEINIFCLIEYCIPGKFIFYMVQIFNWKYTLDLKYFNGCYKRPKYESDNVFKHMGNTPPPPPLHGLAVPVGLGLLIVEVPRSHTHITLGRTPLDDWSVRLRNLYLTTYKTHERETSMPLAEFELPIPANKRPQTHALVRADTGLDSTRNSRLHECILYVQAYLTNICTLSLT